MIRIAGMVSRKSVPGLRPVRDRGVFCVISGRF